MLDVAEKDQIVLSARSFLDKIWPQLPKHKGCLYASYCIAGEIYKRYGLNAMIQAGSMSWPLMDIEEAKKMDTPSHFSYLWSPNSFPSILAISMGRLPEMHTWVAVKEWQEIIDIQTCYFPIACKEATGYDMAIQPPDYIWCNPKDLPDHTFYEPDISAMKLAANKIVDLVLPDIRAYHESCKRNI